MPTLVAALTLSALLRMAHVDMPRWHLASAFALLVTLTLRGSMPWGATFANGVGSFLAAWLYFALLERTDNRKDRVAHWATLVGGYLALIGSRFYLDIRVYGISF